MVAIGGIADKVGLWRALDMTRLTRSRHPTFKVPRLRLRLILEIAAAAN